MTTPIYVNNTWVLFCTSTFAFLPARRYASAG